MIKAAINGRRSAGENEAIPVTTNQVAHAAKTATLAGAGAIHFHVRDDNGQETFEAKWVAEQLNAV